MATSIVLSGLVEKRAELAGEIHQAEGRLEQRERPAGLAITHIFPYTINRLRAALKEVPFCTEPFGGRPLRVTFRAQT